MITRALNGLSLLIARATLNLILNLISFDSQLIQFPIKLIPDLQQALNLNNLRSDVIGLNL